MQIRCLILDTHQIWHPRIVDLVSYLSYSSHLAPAHSRFSFLFWILTKSGIRADQILCLISDTHQIWHLHVEELVSYLSYTHQIWHQRIVALLSYLEYLSNLAPTHCRFGVLSFILIKSGTHRLQIWCFILDTHRAGIRVYQTLCLIFHTHQIGHPRIEDLVSYSVYSSNLVPAHCSFGVLFWILIKSGTCAL